MGVIIGVIFSVVVIFIIICLINKNIPVETNKYLNLTKGGTRQIYYNFVFIVSDYIAPYLLPLDDFYISEKSVELINAVYYLGMVDELSDKNILFPEEHFNFYLGALQEVNKKKRSIKIDMNLKKIDLLISKNTMLKVLHHSKSKKYFSGEKEHNYIVGKEFDDEILKKVYLEGRRISRMLSFFQKKKLSKPETEEIINSIGIISEVFALEDITSNTL